MPRFKGAQRKEKDPDGINSFPRHKINVQNRA